jgi:Uma2 family endonuclease
MAPLVRAALRRSILRCSLTRDLTDKPPIYAQAGIPVYWAVDLERQRAITHSSRESGSYTNVDAISGDGELVQPDHGLRIALPELFAAAAR